jgi:hypothetical protein
MRTVWLRAGLTALAVLALGPDAQASRPRNVWPAYKTLSPNGQYVFVMRSPEEGRWGPEGPEIHRLYPKSGLYRNDGSNTPLWTVDWYVPNDLDSTGIGVASDGIHLVLHHNWWRGRDIYDAEVLSFFANGQLLRTYRLRELSGVSGWSSRGDIYWVKGVGFPSNYQVSPNKGLDDKRLRYTVRTEDGRRFVFDMRTGEIISVSTIVPWFRVLALVIARALLLAVVVALFFHDRVNRWSEKVSASLRMLCRVLIIPVALLAFLGISWYVTIEHYQGWGWIVTGFATVVCVIGIVNLLWRPDRGPLGRLLEQSWEGAEPALSISALGFGFAALGLWVY